MRRAAKVAGWIIVGVALLLIVLAGGVWLAGNTNTGRGWIERLTYRVTSGTVKLSGLGGSFPTQLTLVELQLSDRTGVWLTADRVALRWSPLRLLQRRIRVDELQAARVHMERTPVGSGQGGKVSIPFIEIGSFSLEMVELGAPLVGTPTALTARGNLQLRSLEDANGDLVARRLNGDGEYTLHLHLDPRRMDASLAVHEPASGPLENILSLPGLGALSAAMTLQGPRNAERMNLTLDAGSLHGQVRGSIDLAGLAGNLDYSLTAPAMAPRADVAWQRVELQGNFHGSLAVPAADGRLDIEGLRIAGGTKIARLNAGLASAGGKLLMHAVVNGLQIPGPQPNFLAQDPLTLDASLLLTDALRPLDVVASHRLFTLRAHAETAAAKSGRQNATLQLRLPDLAPFATFAAQDVRGNATIDAQLMHGDGENALTLDANLGLTGGTEAWIGILGPRVAVKLSGALSEGRITLDNLRLAGNAVTFTASGSANRPLPPPGGAAPAVNGAMPPAGAAPSPAGAGKATAPASATSFIKDLQAGWRLDVGNLAVLSEEVAGNLKMSGRLSGSPASMAVDADMTSTLSVRGSTSGTLQATVHARGLPHSPSGIIEANGMLDGAPLRIDAALDRGRDDELRVQVRKAEWKSAHIDGDVTANAALTQSHGQLHLNIGQLGDFDRLLGASIAGSVAGSVGFVPGQGHTQARLELDGTHLVVGKLAGDMHLLATGTYQALGLQLTVKLPALYGAAASLTAASTLNIDARELRLDSAAFDYRGATLRLLAPAKLSFGKATSIDELKLGAGEAVFDLKGQLAPTLDLRASLAQVNPALINVFMPELLAAGSFDARVRLRGNPSSPAGTLRFDATGVRFADDAATGLPPLDVHARAQLADDTATVTATLNAGSGSLLTATGTAPLNGHGALNMKISGKLDVGMANPLLEARGLHAAGALTVDATVTGSAAAPQVGGGITLSQGSVRDYVRGVNLSDINAEVVGDEGGVQIKSFNAKAVSGSVTMAGTFGVLQPGMPLDLKITARNAQPVASSIITANLDADLHVSGKARERIDVAGKVHVSRATIGIPNSLPPDVAVLDVRRRGQAAPEAGGKPLIIGLDVAVQAPQEILVQGRGLDAELGGEIDITGTSAEPLVGGGFDLLRGNFTLAGNRLNFTQGRVSFDGAGLRKKIDPTLDFTAQTTLAETTATLRITGVADAPRFDFSSSPPLPQDQIMAQLLFGQNVAQLSALQYAQIGAALATLSGVGGGGNPLTKLQKALGLDRLSVGANTTTTATGATENSGAAIAAGRYVTKRIYIEGKQTTAGTSQVQVDVDLTKHLKLQTRLGNGTAITQGTTPENDPGSSIGLSYQFEY